MVERKLLPPLRRDQLRLLYSLRLVCQPEDVDLLSTELWESGTIGIREEPYGSRVLLIAGFEPETSPDSLLARFRSYSPEWLREPEIDWVQRTHQAWPPKLVGKSLFLAAPWNTEQTPEGRLRVVHNPGLASGTGEHPCTQLALRALEDNVKPGDRVIDVGTGSGMLAIAAAHLGALTILGVDIDFEAIQTARENTALNRLALPFVVGSAGCLASAIANVTVANISATVLLSILEELFRITAPGGCLILTGFSAIESERLSRYLPPADVSSSAEWHCFVIRLSSASDW